ncbi:MAG: DNA cytosine methyltransferase [Acidiphilium sp.]|nr:DNA cytosine methyltransferase [Acidiphilium sp.]MDD4937093.1 DNA cytosine methyltransferase [Acidiphilium sp.]
MTDRTPPASRTFYEFFAGGGMARAGLGKQWSCLFANDFDPKKVESYVGNWGSTAMVPGDVASIETSAIPGHAGLAWASFPCQDLSLAGAGAGLDGDRSGTFWAFWGHIRRMKKSNRTPKIIVLENVCGALTSNEGADFRAIAAAMSGIGYRMGALVINASRFVPQSRPRLFIIGVAKSHRVPDDLVSDAPIPAWHPASLVDAVSGLSGAIRNTWLWWNLPEPPARTTIFADLIEEKPRGVSWHSKDETDRLLSMMTPRNFAKVELALSARRRMVGTIYRRTRADGPNGSRVQRAEIRCDEIAGCLRTPLGGSSRQTIMVIENGIVRSRLISPRETARLMGLPESYILPTNYNDAYHLTGDGLVVPVVAYLARNLIEPLVDTEAMIARAA